MNEDGNLEQSLSRRGILRASGIAVAGLAAARFLPAAEIAGKVRAGLLDDTDILNFALNLEYLEAEFYTYAMTGSGLPADMTGGKGAAGSTMGGMKVSFDDNVMTSIVRAIMEDEWAHVKFLRTALGDKAVAKPEINLNALGLGFKNETEFLILSRAFEDTGVSAYAGAAKLIKNKDYLQAAAQILAAEAYHGGAIRQQLIYKAIDAPALDAKDKAPALRAIFPTDKDGLAPVRDAGEVGKIVRGASDRGDAFFPKGLNGAIR